MRSYCFVEGNVAAIVCLTLLQEMTRILASQENLVLMAPFPLILFTATQTCYCCEQKIFSRPDDCATLQKFFVISILRIFTAKIEKKKIQLRVNSSLCAGAFQLLRSRAA
jgi:hypothetical protein